MLVSPPGVAVNLPSIWGWSIEVKRTAMDAIVATIVDGGQAIVDINVGL